VIEFDKPISRVFYLLRFQRFLGVLVWVLAATLLLAALAFGVEKLGGWPLPGPDWAPLAISGGVSLLLASGAALVSGPSRVDAAVAIDRAFHLNERLSTALTLPSDLRETPAGQALVADTIRHVESLDLGSRFGLKPPRRAWVPVVPAVLALGLMLLPATLFQTKAAARNAKIQESQKKTIAKQTEALSKTIAQKRDQMDKTKFPEADKLLAQIEKTTQELAKTPPSEKERALVQLNKLTDAVKERQQQLGDAQQIQRQLQQLKEMTSDGPADKFAKDLAKGEFREAAKELQKLQDKILSGQMSEQEKQQLRQQLSEMKRKLEQMANLEQRQKQLEDARKNGTLTEQQFQQQMTKLNEQARDLQKMKELAQQLGQSQSSMDQGNMQKAAEALGMSQQQLSQMAQQLEELEMLDGSLVDLQDAKAAINGEGMNQLGSRLDDIGMGNGMGNQAGQGLGRGRGQGDRPEAPDQTATYKTQVRPQASRGAALKIGQGPPRAQTKGESILEVQDLSEAGTGLEAEALSNQRVPKAVQKHVTGYFDQFRRDN
jgi:hypothetical protein